MNAELRPISLLELREYLRNIPDAQIIEEFSRMADPLLAAIYDQIFLGLVAFTPRSALSDEAYVWIYVSDVGRNHKIVIGKLYRRWIKTVHSRYKCLIAHCENNQHDRSWVEYIGGKFTGTDGKLLRFIVEDAQ